MAAEQAAAEPVFPEPLQQGLVPGFLDMDPDPRIILLELPEDPRQPAGGNAVVAAHEQFPLVQAQDPVALFPYLPAPVEQSPYGRQQSLPFPGQPYPLGGPGQ